MIRNRQMKLRGFAVVVRIPSRNDAGTARTAAARRQIGIRKLHSIRSQTVDVGRPRPRVPVATVVVPTDIIGDEKYNVGRFSQTDFRRQRQHYEYRGKKESLHVEYEENQSLSSCNLNDRFVIQRDPDSNLSLKAYKSFVLVPL